MSVMIDKSVPLVFLDSDLLVLKDNWTWFLDIGSRTLFIISLTVQTYATRGYGKRAVLPNLKSSGFTQIFVELRGTACGFTRFRALIDPLFQMYGTISLAYAKNKGTRRTRGAAKK
jgi:hypothetical protein